MIFCYSVLTPIVLVVRTLIQVVREIVKTVCDWVSSTITTIKTVVEKICTWLPWPLDKLCELVEKTIEVVETVWDWVCHEVIETVIDWVEQITEYVFYILRWLCWVLTWLTRGPALLLCILGLRPRRFMAVCIKVLTDRDGTPAVDWPKVDQDVEQARQILANCDIELVVIGREQIEKPEFMDGTTCDFGGMFTRFFTWFAANECSDCSAVTVYYVRNIPGNVIGCAYPGSNWVTVASDGDGRTMVQEIGHLADLWGHSDDPDNVMTDQGGGTSDQITGFQCCMFRTSRFARLTPCPSGVQRVGEAPIGVEAERRAPQQVRGTQAFRRLRATERQSAEILRERVVQAGIAAAIVYWIGRRLARRIRRGL